MSTYPILSCGYVTCVAETLERICVESNSLTTVPANFTGQPVAASVIKTATSWGIDGKG